MRKQVEILDVPIDIVSSEEAFEKLKTFLEGDKLNKVFTPNPEIVMIAQEDRELARILREADLVLADGIGLIIASKIKNLGLKERVTGIDTMEKLLTYSAEQSKSIYLLGGKPGNAELACKNIEKAYSGIRIAGFHHGYFKEEDVEKIIEDINKNNSDILFVALGAPKQEKWIDLHKDKLNCKIAMGVGGAVDIYAGTAKRAPIIFQKLGLEWFYRLLKEPWRIKRMMNLPKFLLYILFKR
ncbi:MAG: WecB/TagA/CpsF family glycosyltransferase [Clostridiales bacterium]|nr:WecB/TagA/CpsF family glycosyltransferase [Clostridiales bacterium]